MAEVTAGGEGDAFAPLPDLTRTSIADLLSNTDPVFIRAVARLVADVNCEEGAITAFGNIP